MIAETLAQTLRATVAANIKRRRLHLGWRQEDLARLTGFPRSYIGHVERAEKNVGVDTIERIAQALGTTGAVLLDPAGTDQGGAPRQI